MDYGQRVVRDQDTWNRGRCKEYHYSVAGNLGGVSNINKICIEDCKLLVNNFRILI